MTQDFLSAEFSPKPVDLDRVSTQISLVAPEGDPLAVSRLTEVAKAAWEHREAGRTAGTGLSTEAREQATGTTEPPRLRYPDWRPLSKRAGMDRDAAKEAGHLQNIIEQGLTGSMPLLSDPEKKALHEHFEKAGSAIVKSTQKPVN